MRHDSRINKNKGIAKNPSNSYLREHSLGGSSPPLSNDLIRKFIYPLVILAGFLFIPQVLAAPIQGTASWYSTECCKYNPYNGCPTASGKSLFLLEAKSTDFAAMWGVPLGAKAKVTNVSNGRSVVVTILDRGPAKRLHRVIDLSKHAFKKIADPRQGVISVRVEVLP